MKLSLTDGSEMQNSKPRIVRLTHDAGWGYDIEAILGPVAEIETFTAKTVNEVTHACMGAIVLVVTHASQRRLVQEALPSLADIKYLYVSGSGYDPIDPGLAGKQGIILCHNPDFCTQEVAEHAVALMLSAWRKITAVDRRIRGGGFPSWQEFRPITRIWGKTAGVVGFGRSGQAVAKRLKGLGMRVVVYDHHAERKQALLDEIAVIPVSFQALLKEADAVTLHVPLNAETDKMIGRKELQMMKRSAILVNTSRGQVLDETALVDALRQDVISGAALDVFEEEPLPEDHSLRKLENAILNAHMASTSEESTSLTDLAHEIKNVLAGGNPLNPVSTANPLIYPPHDG